MYPSEVPVIRLIFLENDQFLFVKDVDYAIKRALINKKRKPVVPDGMLRLESAEEIKNGTFYMIPRSEYLKVLKKLKVDEKDITVSIQIHEMKWFFFSAFRRYSRSFPQHFSLNLLSVRDQVQVGNRCVLRVAEHSDDRASSLGP